MTKMQRGSLGSSVSWIDTYRNNMTLNIPGCSVRKHAIYLKYSNIIMYGYSAIFFKCKLLGLPICIPFKLEWLSTHILSSSLIALVTYRHVKNWFTHLLDRRPTTSCLDSKLFLIFKNKNKIYDIYTGYCLFYCLTFNCDCDLRLT